MYERPEGIENCKIWIDGCFDFAHHGHAGAMLQARQLGKELYVGVHSDEEILHNKGPVVMKLDERMSAVEACKWSTVAVANAPYVTTPEFMDLYGCKYVVHGDDITTDANGKDCYQEVKDLGKFVVVKRTPNISTTDLVGRMLLMSKTHHYQPILSLESSKSHPLLVPDNIERFGKYASDQTGLKKGSGVYLNVATSPLQQIVEPSASTEESYHKIYYVDGGFDLFHPGHIEALKTVKLAATKAGASVVVGIHDDATINKHKGLNYPIMSLFERSLCVLQCRYVDGLIIGAPFAPDSAFLSKLPGKVVKAFHGPTEMYEKVDPYKEVKELGIYEEIGPHRFDNMDTEFIVSRVLSNKTAFEERQKRKGWKAQVEEKLREAEKAKQ